MHVQVQEQYVKCPSNLNPFKHLRPDHLAAAAVSGTSNGVDAARAAAN
jgi:hypothetical protein